MKKCFLFLSVFYFSCENPQEKEEQLRFTKMSSEHTGIEFINELTLTKDLDVFRYRNYYNGGGVAIGDVNNDGLPDIFLTANMGPNKLYLNKGNFEFEDITEKAGVAGTKDWSTGVSMADVNGDGLLDIYVCNSGDVKGGNRENELFINNGDLTFTESAVQYGLDDKGFSTHAVFFDYDQDGDLDCYVLNNSFRPVSSLGYENIRHQRDSTGGDKLYRNDHGQYMDVSEEAGIFGSVIGFGLGVTITDVDLDGWLDLYVSNDFFERDYLYMNQGDGTFKEELTQRMGHISNFSMGTDAADINNDGFPDIYVTDMLPEDDYRLKTMTSFESYNLHQIKLSNDYYEQYMRNTLQLNRGDGSFLEIGQYSGVAATDWSWGALIADFDNDSNKEIFVTNGVYKDVTDQDFINFLANEDNMINAMRTGKVDFQKLVDKMPSNKLSNYLFKKKDGLTFENVAAAWGLDEPSFSNGAAYGDLDNDGDLDLIVNNVNQDLFVYRNETNNISNNNYLKISFEGPDKNTFGVGARVNAYHNGEVIMLENVPTKGFQSSMDYTMVMGLGSVNLLDSLLVHWGYNKFQKLTNVKANQHLIVNIHEADTIHPTLLKRNPPILTEKEVSLSPPYKHTEDPYVDFDRERLIYHMLSREGPAMTVADVNNDELDDFFAGGASESPGRLYMQNKQGGFDAVSQDAFEKDKIYEDVDALFFDADGDGDLDLYVVSGGYSFRENDKVYQDRLYILTGFENGKPFYERSMDALPKIFEMGSCVNAADYDKDGDMDLFVGTRAVPTKYGLSSPSRLLQNDGKGKFMDVTSRVAPGLASLGMVTDAEWVDYDNDGDMDLVVVGEWMPVVLLKNNGTNLERLNNIPGLEKSEGWWNTIEAVDLNNDGNTDFIAGNWGLNSRFKTSEEKPLTLYINDFDNNGMTDQVYAYYQGDKLYPMALKQELVAQLPYLKKDFVYHKDYAGKTIQEIFTEEQLTNANINKIHKLQSAIILNNGDGSYEIKALPEAVQLSPVFSILHDDFDNDGKLELFLAGNFSGTKPEEGRYDANHGIILEVNGKEISVKEQDKSGLDIKGDVRNAGIARTINNKKLLIIAKNNDELAFYVY